MTKVKLTVNNNGSLKVDGDFEIVDAQGSFERSLQRSQVLKT
jgi:hypothetical protein